MTFSLSQIFRGTVANTYILYISVCVLARPRKPLKAVPNSLVEGKTRIWPSSKIGLKWLEADLIGADLIWSWPNWFRNWRAHWEALQGRRTADHWPEAGEKCPQPLLWVLFPHLFWSQILVGFTWGAFCRSEWRLAMWSGFQFGAQSSSRASDMSSSNLFLKLFSINILNYT